MSKLRCNHSKMRRLLARVEADQASDHRPASDGSRSTNQPRLRRECCISATNFRVRSAALVSNAKWVLVVDDDDDIRSVTIDVLESAGYLALGAPGGIEALRIMTEKAPTLVLSDLTMSGMDGRRLLTNARELLGSSTPPFVFLTAVEPSKRDDLSEPVLTKPYGMDELLGVVEQHCRS